MSARFLQDQIERKKGEREGHEVKGKGHKESFVTSSVSFVTFVFAPGFEVLNLPHETAPPSAPAFLRKTRGHRSRA